MTDSRIQYVLEYTNGPTVLDLGAVQHDAENSTRGDWLHGHLVSEFDRVIGVDMLAADVAELNQQGYEMVQADVTEMQLDVTADTVVAGELIEHVANPGSMLDRIRSHLKPDGRVIITTPNPWAAVHLRRHVTGAYHINEEHVAWYGPRTLRQLLSRYGFDVVELHTTNRDHNGLTGLAQRLGSDVFGGTTWICVAERGDNDGNS